MSKWLVRLALLVALTGGVAPLLAGRNPPPQAGAGALMQQPYQKPPTGFILGQIVDASTGQPIAGAVVTINGAPPGPPLTTLPNGAPVSPTDPASLEAQAAARNSRLMTNSSGQFVFHDLRGGSYGVTATAPGYVAGSFGQHVIGGPSRAIELPDDGHVGDATIKLWRYASVSGHVLDDVGEPVVGAYVRVLRATTIGARRTLVPGLQATTDDRGLYRFDALTPADYVLTIQQTTTTVPASNVEAYMNAITSGGSAASDLIRETSASNAPFPSPGGIRIGDQQVQASMGQRALPIAPAADLTHLSVYMSEFYPAAATSADASALTLASGEKRTGVDLQLRVVPGVNVSGTITGPEGAVKFTGVRLLPASSEKAGLDVGFETATSVTDANGAFTFVGVPGGQYTVKVQRLARPQVAPNSMVTVMTTSGNGGMSFGFATSIDSAPPPTAPSGPSFFGELALNISDHDVDGVAVVLRRGVHVSGKLVFEGSSAPPTADLLQRLSIALQSVDGGAPLPMAAPRVQADGQFTSLNYPPGRYLVNPGGAGFGAWTVRSITLGGRNLDETPLELQDDDVSGVVVLFSDQATEVRGTVHAGTGPVGDGDVTVFAFPSNYAAWIDQGMSTRRQKSSTTGKTGGYTLSGLPAGEYLVAAVPADAVTNMRDVRFFDALARVSTRLTLADGENKSLDLAVASIR